MGNCLRRGSTIQCGGDDYWTSSPIQNEFYAAAANTSHLQQKEEEEEEEEFLTSIEEKKVVKIKMSRKQLEELLGIMNDGKGTIWVQQQGSSWRPNLQSIPE
ncbi:hypothetical protein LINPERHAP1_LOCUS18600 [Linum perenne]